MQTLSYPNSAGKKVDFAILVILSMLSLFIYYPVFYTDYLYTDEATQVWLTDKNVNLTSVIQGRYITYIIFKAIFGFIHSAAGVRYARIISFAGWFLCLPIWYFMLRRLLVKNGLPLIIAGLCCGYLICMPPFTISIGWAACLEMFVACTAGLIAGFTWHIGMEFVKSNSARAAIWIMGSVVAAMISLFTYQNGFGCFFIAPFIQLIGRKLLTKKFCQSILWAFLLYVVYYFLFKLSLFEMSMTASVRTQFAQNPLPKIIFLFTRPLAASFHFTYLLREKSAAGIIVYLFAALLLVFCILYRLRRQSNMKSLGYMCGIIVVFISAYVPSLIANENYPSNRTLLALNLLVFLLLSATIFDYIKPERVRYGLTFVLMTMFTINAWYNFRYEFVFPLSREYSIVKSEVLHQFTSATDSILYVRPPETSFENKYGIIRSWDEFGVPSTTKIWVPDPLLRQIIFETTGSKERAVRIVIESFESEKALFESKKQKSDRTILIRATSGE